MYYDDVILLFAAILGIVLLALIIYMLIEMISNLFKLHKKIEIKIKKILLGVFLFVVVFVGFFHPALISIGHDYAERELRNNKIGQVDLRSKYRTFRRWFEDDGDYYLFVDNKVNLSNKEMLLNLIFHLQSGCIKVILDEGVEWSCNYKNHFVKIHEYELDFLPENLKKDEDFMSVFLEDLYFYLESNGNIKNYLKFQEDLLKGININYSNNKDLVYSLYRDFTNTIKYNSAIEDLSSKLNSTNLSDYVQEYNLQEAFNSVHTYQNKEAVCQGIVNLLYLSLRYGGIDNVETRVGEYIIDSNGGEPIGHIWLKIGNYYYDPTFDLEKSPGQRKYYKETKNDFYNENRIPY